MDWTQIGLFLILVMAGAYVQTITGFAMGLLIIGGVTILKIVPIEFTAAVVSILSLFNSLIVLRYSMKHVNWKIVTFVSAGMLPAVVLGIYLLTLLSADETEWLRRILGVVIIVAGILLTLKPEPKEKLSGNLSASLAGVAGGILGGMFSTGGAPLAFFLYSQPISLNVIRATLLATFALSTLGRTLIIAAEGQLSADMMTVSALALPVVFVTTLFARKFAPANSETIIRKAVFILLIFIGAALVFS